MVLSPESGTHNVMIGIQAPGVVADKPLDVIRIQGWIGAGERHVCVFIKVPVTVEFVRQEGVPASISRTAVRKIGQSCKMFLRRFEPAADMALEGHVVVGSHPVTDQ